MGGRLGGSTVTLKNTEILFIDLKDNILFLKGSVPGKKNTLLKIQP
jgi:large subunit ribosomal protein L3